jgi:glutathionyl-hydroquinone reductase
MNESDICLFTTLIRFDYVYYTHFKCNNKHIYEYKNLWEYTRMIANNDVIKNTIHVGHIKDHYFKSHTSINQFGIVPIGPILDFTYKNEREKKF